RNQAQDPGLHGADHRLRERRLLLIRTAPFRGDLDPPQYYPGKEQNHVGRIFNPSPTGRIENPSYDLSCRGNSGTEALSSPGNRVMSKESQLRQVLDCGIVAVVRSPDSQQLVEVCRALADGDVSVVEITMTVPNALDVVRQVRQALGDRLLLGAGTILDPETARAVLLAGAEYIV